MVKYDVLKWNLNNEKKLILELILEILSCIKLITTSAHSHIEILFLSNKHKPSIVETW